MRKFLRILTILSIVATLFLVLMSFIVYNAIANPEMSQNIRWGFVFPTMTISGLLIILSMAGNFVYAMVGDVWKSVKQLEIERDNYYNAVIKLRDQKEKLAVATLEMNMKNNKFQDGYDVGYNAGYIRKTNEIAHEIMIK